MQTWSLEGNDSCHHTKVATASMQDPILHTPVSMESQQLVAGPLWSHIDAMTQSIVSQELK